MPTTITNPNAINHITMEDVRDYFAGEGIDVVGKSITIGLDELGMVDNIFVDVILTAPQIAAFEEEFFTTNVTALDTKGDVLTHDGTNEVKKVVGVNDTVLTADSTSGDGVSWKPISGGSPVETESNAVLGLSAIQIISDDILGEVVDFDENTIVGDVSKIIDEGNGIFRLHNGSFLINTTLSVSMDGSGGGTFAVFEWESAAVIGGPYTPVAHPAGRAGILNVGRANFSTQPHAIAFINASVADVFVRLRLTPDDNTKPASVLDVTTTGSIDSLGTSAVANSPLTTKGDVLTHNGTNDIRLPVGTDGQVLAALASAPGGLAFIEGGFEKIADETLGAVSAFFDITFPVREFLYIVIYLEENGGSSLNAQFVFNQTVGSQYTYRRDENYGTITTNTSQSRVQLDAGTPGIDVYATLLVFNQAGVDPSFMQRSIGQDGNTAGTLPETQIIDGIWAEALGSRVDELNIETTIGMLSTNSRVVVYGSKT